jgi:hypothetical protein
MEVDYYNVSKRNRNAVEYKAAILNSEPAHITLKQI